MRIYRHTLINLGCAFLLSACHSANNQEPATKDAHIEQRELAQELVFKTHIQPASSQWVISQIHGQVQSVYVKAGDRVRTGDDLFTLQPTGEKQDLKSALNHYLTAKNTYLRDKAHYRGDIMLHKAGIDSEQQFSANRSVHDNHVMSYYTARFELQAACNKWRLNCSNYLSLTQKDFPHFLSTLKAMVKPITYKAQSPGVVLHEPNKSTPFPQPGMNVTEHSPILKIANTGSYRFVFLADQSDVLKLRKGLPVRINSENPKCDITGVITRVSEDAEIETDHTSKQVNYAVESESSGKLTPTCAHMFYGMNATIRVNLGTTTEFIVPIETIHQSGENYFLVESRTHNKLPLSSIGKTTPDGKIAVTGALAQGTKVDVAGSKDAVA